MNSSNWPTIPIGSLGKGSGVAWSYIAPSRGVFQWGRLDAYVNVAEANNVSLFYANQGVPPWAASDQSSCHPVSFNTTSCTSGVNDIQDWIDFVDALVTRYRGRIQYYELWNEPQNGFSGTMAELVALTNAEHDSIRSLDPSAQILSPSAISYGSQYLDDYFGAGGTTDIDVVTMHLYPNVNNDVAESVTGSAPAAMASVMNKYGVADKPLWDTESSWGYESQGAITDPNLRAAYLARSFLLHWSVGLGREYWYGWDNSDIGTLWSPNGGLEDAGTAFTTVYSWMVGSTMSTCSDNGASSPYHALYTCDMVLADGSNARAVWNTDGDTTYTVPAQFTWYRDLRGTTFAVPAGQQITAGITPILLEQQ